MSGIAERLSAGWSSPLGSIRRNGELGAAPTLHITDGSVSDYTKCNTLKMGLLTNWHPGPCWGRGVSPSDSNFSVAVRLKVHQEKTPNRCHTITNYSGPIGEYTTDARCGCKDPSHPYTYNSQKTRSVHFYVRSTSCGAQMVSQVVQLGAVLSVVAAIVFGFQQLARLPNL